MAAFPFVARVAFFGDWGFRPLRSAGAFACAFPAAPSLPLPLGVPLGFFAFEGVLDDSRACFPFAGLQILT